MKSILRNYLDQEIGMNLEKPFGIGPAKLIAVEDDHFSVVDDRDGYTHHFSYQSIVRIIEHPEGITLGGLFSHSRQFRVVVKVGHLVEYIPG